jgi:hypothetical protein
MDSKERVKAALRFNDPDNVPIFNMIRGDVFPLPITHSKHWKPGWNVNEENLFPYIRGIYNWDRPDWAKNNPDYEGNKWKKIPHEEIDEWGCIWNLKGDDRDKGHPGRPSLNNWDEFNDYFNKYTPDASDRTRYESAINLLNNLQEEKYKTLHLNCNGPSQVISNMRGFERYLVDHRKHPDELKMALKIVAEYHVDVIKYAQKYGIQADGLWIVDDLGQQTGPYFGPKMFEKIHEESYRIIIEGAHEMGLDIHHHCCGKIDLLLKHLIDWGLDAIELDSPRMSGYPDLKKYRGKIMFWGCVNIQSIYTLGSPEEVEREVWHMIRNLGTKHGGYGAYFYDNPKDLNIPRKNIKAFQRGLNKFGVYSNIPEKWWDYPISNEWEDNVVPSLPPNNL